MSVDVVGFGDAEVGVEGQGVMPVMASLVDIAGDLVGVGEAVVCAGMLVWLTDLAGQGQGRSLVGEGLVEIADELVGVGEAVVCAGLLVPVADLGGQG